VSRNLKYLKLPLTNLKKTAFFRPTRSVAACNLSLIKAHSLGEDKKQRIRQRALGLFFRLLFFDEVVLRGRFFVGGGANLILFLDYKPLILF